MLAGTSAKIIEALQQTGQFRKTGIWQGDVKLLMDTAHKLPSAHCLFSAGEFGPPAVIGARTAPAEMLWSVVIINESLRDIESGALEAYRLIAAVTAPASPQDPQETPGLTRLDTGHGWLWPVRVQFIGAELGKIAYGIHFRVESN